MENTIDEIIDATHLRIQDRVYLHFTGNNYLGLAGLELVKQGACEAIAHSGVNFAASRCTTGNSQLHQRLERHLADFKGQEDALCYATGFLGNAILLELLGREVELVLLDEQVHPSIRWAVGQRYPLRFYTHCDMDALEQILAQHRRQRVVVMTDGVFPLSGEIAPLAHLAVLAAEYDNLSVIVDDAHATGVLGARGRGTLEYFGLQAPNFYQTETMSKALGAYGGFISGAADLVARLRDQSHIYAGSTALPPACVGAALAALRYLANHPELLTQLQQNVRYLKAGLRQQGWPVDNTPVPIIPLYYPDHQQAAESVARLRQQGIFVIVIDYPGNRRPLVRLTVNAGHTTKELDTLLASLGEAPRSWDRG